MQSSLRWYNRIKLPYYEVRHSTDMQQPTVMTPCFKGCFLLQFLQFLSNVHFMFALKSEMSAHSLFIFWGKSSENILNSIGYDADGLLKLNTTRLFLYSSSFLMLMMMSNLIHNWRNYSEEFIAYYNIIGYCLVLWNRWRLLIINLKYKLYKVVYKNTGLALCTRLNIAVS